MWRRRGASVAFDGRAGMDPQAAGRVEADVPNPNAFMAALGLGEAGIAGKAAFAGNVTYTKDGKIALREGTATALGNTVSVEADVSMDGPRPRVQCADRRRCDDPCGVAGRRRRGR